MTAEELNRVLEMQEEILQFSSFTNGDAWELGNMILMEARRLGVSIAVRIRTAMETPSLLASMRIIFPSSHASPLVKLEN